MPLFEQKYPNNIRTISGLINPVFQDDVTLLCDTSAGAVNIQLLSIPYTIPNPLATPNQYIGFYNTQYQLYVVDYGNNSLVNNITITAPLGFTINGQPSVTLASNGASYLIVIGSQTNYLALYGGLISGTTPLLISLTNAQMLNLIATNTVVAGQFYLVTDALDTDGGVVIQGDAINGSSVNGTGLYYNADYQAVGNYSGVVGFTANIGIWWNPTPPNPLAFPVTAGQVVIFNNQHYLNLTNAWWDGVNAPPSDPVNWQLIPKSPTGGYIRACDFVRYNVQTNRVVYRADANGNEVDWTNKGGATDSILLFQWGRNSVTFNKVRTESIMFCTNSYSNFFDNTLENNSSISDTTAFVLGGGGIMKDNVLLNDSQITTQRLLGSIRRNRLDTDSSISTTVVDSASQINENSLSDNATIVLSAISQTTINSNNLYTQGNITILNSNQLTFNNNMFSANGSFVVENNTPPSSVQFCEVSDITARYRQLNENLINRKCRTGFSNFALTIDCSVAPIPNQSGGFVGFPVNTLTIDSLYEQHYGIIFISRFTLAFGNTILKISGATTNHPITFYPTFVGGGGTPQFTTTAVGVAGADDLVSDLVAPANIIIANDPSSVTISKPRTPSFNIIEDYNLIQ